MAFRIVAHTADLAIEADGSDEGHALDQAAQGLTQVLTAAPDGHPWRPDREQEIVVEAPDHAALLVAWLAELLWLYEAEDLVWVGGGVDIEETADGVRARATGNMVRHDPAVHPVGVEVKAVTYHDLRSGWERDGSWRVHVLLDI